LNELINSELNKFLGTITNLSKYITNIYTTNTNLRKRALFEFRKMKTRKGIQTIDTNTIKQFNSVIL